MAELEEAGFVEQPHTSAGRVPTDKGYRYYVDNILGEAATVASDLKAIDQLFAIAILMRMLARSTDGNGVARSLGAFTKCRNRCFAVAGRKSPEAHRVCSAA